MNRKLVAGQLRRLAELERQRAELLDELAAQLAELEPRSAPPRRPGPRIVAPEAPIDDLQRARARRALRRAGLEVKGDP